MYGDGEYDLAGFAVGAVEREALIDGSRIGAGHKLLGLASSGLHSNGYSLVRKVIEHAGADLDAFLDEDIDPSATLGQTILEPTRIYVKPLLPLLKSGQIDGLAHITGGGLSENIIRILGDELSIRIDTSSWTTSLLYSGGSRKPVEFLTRKCAAPSIVESVWLRLSATMKPMTSGEN